MTIWVSIWYGEGDSRKQPLILIRLVEVRRKAKMETVHDVEEQRGMEGEGRAFRDTGLELEIDLLDELQRFIQKIEA